MDIVSLFQFLSINLNLRSTHIPISMEAKTAKARRKQNGDMGKKAADEKTKSEKRSHVLERNRIAAGKCRTRKKATISVLEERCRMLKAKNTMMRELACELMGEIESLKSVAQLHEAGKCTINRNENDESDGDRQGSKVGEVEVELQEKKLVADRSDAEAD